MGNVRATIVLFCTLAIAIAAAQPALAKDSIDAGLRRGLHYTCRIGSGGVIVTTDQSVAEDPDTPKSNAFIEKAKYAPVDIARYREQQKKIGPGLRVLEEVLIGKLDHESRDWRPGTKRTVTVTAEEQSDLPASERMIQLSRVKIHPSVITYDKETFTQMTGSRAAVGEAVHLDKGVAGKVVSIDGNAVKVKFTPQSEESLTSAFGPLIVTKGEGQYTIEIDVENGRLVNVGPAVGKVVQVGERNFQVDYAHPFGGETLRCEVQVVAIEEDSKAQEQFAQQKEPENGRASGTATEGKPVVGAAGDTVEAGDLVTVDYTAKLRSGEVLWTTEKAVAADPETKKYKEYAVQEIFEPETILAGGKDAFPGLGYAVIGMKAGEQHKVIVPAEEAFGGRDKRLLRKFDRKNIVSTRTVMPAQQYIQRFGGFPVKGKKVSYNAYIEGRVVDVTEKEAVLELAPIQDIFESDFGVVLLTVIDDKIHIDIDPKMGGHFELGKRQGKIVAKDPRKFTVDFNKPLSGESILFDVTVQELTKAAEFADMDIQWIEDYDKGLQAAEANNKPTVLVLYADWCGYCKKLFNNTFVDPRIKMISNDFIWVKVNSDKEKSIKTMFQQKSFPLTVLLDSSGEVLGKINGFRPAIEFKSELKKAINAGATAFERGRSNAS